MNGKAWIACLIIAAPTGVVAGQTIAELRGDARVTVSGVVDQIKDYDTFILKDHTGRIPVYLGPNRAPVEVGMAVTVHGIVDDDVPREIYGKRMDLPDGESVQFVHRYD